MNARGLVALSLVVLGGCRDTKLAAGACQQDSDCGSPAAAFRCETQTGVCYCRTDEACPGSQFCNPSGFCQDRAGCATNADCGDPSLFCDTASGQCLPLGRCTSDLDCALGNICDTVSSRCIAGCRRNGDCDNVSCRCGDVACTCTGTTPEELARCAVGVCDPNFCADDTFCRYGELCGAQPDAGSPRASCYNDYDPDVRPYCDRCTFGGGVPTCGNGPNYCLIDTRHPGSSYCGADCSMGQSCPRGYSCQDVIVVLTQWACSVANPTCPTNPSLPCSVDADCKRGGSCVKSAGLPTGFCAGACDIAEGDSQGFCSCQVDEDCATETCTMGECSISRRACVTDGDCKSIRCVDAQGGGGCLIGQNCAPTDGLSCVEVK
jgi:hypothetical protein